jgi:hypothetical protein
MKLEQITYSRIRKEMIFMWKIYRWVTDPYLFRFKIEVKIPQVSDVNMVPLFDDFYSTQEIPRRS